MDINGQNVDVFYDLIDDACMEYYNDLRMDYLDAFCRVTNDILNEFDDSNLSDEAIDKLTLIYEKVYGLNILNEEIRLAVVLLLIKGLKHRNMQLDVVTPDTLVYLYTYIIELITKGKNVSCNSTDFDSKLCSMKTSEVKVFDKEKASLNLSYQINGVIKETIKKSRLCYCW